jgi:hypothetical protein
MLNATTDAPSAATNATGSEQAPSDANKPEIAGYAVACAASGLLVCLLLLFLCFRDKQSHTKPHTPKVVEAVPADRSSGSQASQRSLFDADIPIPLSEASLGVGSHETPQNQATGGDETAPVMPSDAVRLPGVEADPQVEERLQPANEVEETTPASPRSVFTALIADEAITPLSVTRQVEAKPSKRVRTAKRMPTKLRTTASQHRKLDSDVDPWGDAPSLSAAHSPYRTHGSG